MIPVLKDHPFRISGIRHPFHSRCETGHPIRFQQI